jgi:isopentenyl diphosphate isomerase/L-lactate dehydrogenase-like FMN-dependent dehydrogenase
MESTALNVFGYEQLAQQKLAPAVWDYIAAGAEDEVTLARNRSAFERLALRPSLLVDVEQIDTSTTVLGQSIAAPILIAPMGQHGFVCPEAEIATVTAASAAGTILIASISASRPIEDIVAATTGPVWFQMYLFHRDRERSAAMIRRAAAAGCRAIVLTVDSPRWGRKERSLRSEDALPWQIGNLAGLPPSQWRYLDGAPATWADVRWLQSLTTLPIVIKGILTAEDAALAVQHGAAAVVVSNHGGRQLDGAMASIDALPEVVAAAAGRCEVYLDSGVRRGTDALKSLALGARAVFVGRPVLWGLAVDGAQGAADVLQMLKDELAWAMALCGRPTVGSIDRALVR